MEAQRSRKGMASFANKWHCRCDTTTMPAHLAASHVQGILKVEASIFRDQKPGRVSDTILYCREMALHALIYIMCVHTYTQADVFQHFLLHTAKRGTHAPREVLLTT